MKQSGLTWDIVSLTGAVLLAGGLGWAWLPLAPIVAGATLLAVGILGALAQARPALPKSKSEIETRDQ